jgi:hypothetical protein
MAAGLGFKTFNTGDVLSAADVNGYLMQGVLVFASTAARDAAITAPAEGQFAFTKDTNSLFYYDGAAWVASGATGDIEGVTAGTGISGGGTSGTVTITNSMATAIDAKGDLIVGTGADTFSKLTAGTNGYLLTADSAEATGLKWAAAAGGGGMTLLSTTTLSGATTTISSISQSYKDLYIVAFGITNNTADGNLTFQIATPSPAASSFSTGFNFNGTFSINGSGTDNTTYSLVPAINFNDTVPQNTIVVTIPNYKETAVERIATCFGSFRTGGNSPCNFYHVFGQETSTAVSAISLSNSGGTFSGGTVLVYGVN